MVFCAGWIMIYVTMPPQKKAFAKYIDSETVPMRDKEIKQDYRFMPEPNLPPLCLFDNESISTTSCDTSVINIDDIRTKLPPLPEEIRQRLEKNYNIPRQNAALLTVGISFVNGGYQVFQYFSSLPVLHKLQEVPFFFKLNNFNEYFIQHSLKPGGTKDHFRQVEVSGTIPN